MSISSENCGRNGIVYTFYVFSVSAKTDKDMLSYETLIGLIFERQIGMTKVTK